MPNRLQWDVFCQCTNSGRHGRPSAWRERNEMVAYFFNPYFEQA